MLTTSISRAGVTILGSLLLLAAVPVPAEDGRDFAGFYDLRNVTDLGEWVGLTLSLEVFNYSGTDVTDATITLADSFQPDTPYGFFTVVSIPYRESVRLSSSFTIPRSEYDYWQEGGYPNLWIDFYDSTGNTVRRLIEVAWMPLGEEE